LPAVRKESDALSDTKAGMLTLAVDAMGGDGGPTPVVEGVASALDKGLRARVLLFGNQEVLRPLMAEHGGRGRPMEVRHAPAAVAMTDKPMHVLRRGRDTSMWLAVAALERGEAHGVVSGGNTGALMAVSRMQLGMIEGIDRPALTALWPTNSGRTLVLDVGANVEATENELVQYAIMGEAFSRALTGKEKPRVGLLNVGAEELKGHELIRSAARVLREADPEMAFVGFVEGNDISSGRLDVVVTDGFTGNIALKTAEGAARLVGSWMKEALNTSLNSRLASLLMIRGLKKLKARMDPSSMNGGLLLGVSGIVVKSHGGADARGVRSAVEMTAGLAERPFLREIAETVSKVAARRGAFVSSSGPKAAAE